MGVFHIGIVLGAGAESVYNLCFSQFQQQHFCHRDNRNKRSSITEKENGYDETYKL